MAQFRLNMNGDTAKTLEDQFEKINAPLYEVEQAMSIFSLHGRNYQTTVHPGEALTHDLAEYREAMRNLIKVREWLDKNRLHLRRQIDGE